MSKKHAAFLIASTIIAVIFTADYVTPERYSVFIFYIPAIILATWYFGKVTGYAFAGLSSVLWFIAKMHYTNNDPMSVIIWNTLVRIVLFVSLAWLIGFLKAKLAALDFANRELSRSNQDLEKFAHVAAHDLKTPLVSIKGFTEVLEDHYGPGQDQKFKEYTGYIKKSVDRMSGLIEAVLDYAMVEKADDAKKFSPEPLTEICREACTGISGLIDEKKADIQVKELPTLKVHRLLMTSVFQNLIANALKYCDKKPEVLVDAVKGKGSWVIRISDNGPGIPEDAKEKIFIMFERLQHSKEKGSGIGLATCRKIVERHGGRIWVENSKTGGSVFCFTLPADLK